MISSIKNQYQTGKSAGKMIAASLGASEGQVLNDTIGSVFGLIFLAFLLPVGYTQIQDANMTNIPGGDFLATGAFALIVLAAGFRLVMNIMEGLNME